MENQLINEDLQIYRDQIEEAVKNLHELTQRIGHDELANTVSDLRSRLGEPFMFVIAGEVKAGKSSFINALLGADKEVAKVAPQPMTDTIQQILYGPEEKVVEINPFLKKIYLPVDILQEIAIVDTPGTNTIIDHHQEITESFIPASDLIVFVFEAKNPYRRSAWDFFEYIHADWRKKIIFILQQKDLMADGDLEINVEGVAQHAKDKGIENPQIFTTSAKMELEGDTEHSGFAEVRQFISDNITGGKAPLLKLQNNVSTGINILERISNGLDLRRRQYEADLNFREDIRQTLEQQSLKSLKQVDVLVENLLAAYDRVTGEREKELRNGLNFFSLLRRTFAGIFSKKESAKEWLEGMATELEKDLNHELRGRLDDGVGDLADSIQQMAKLIDLKIRSSETILRNDHDIFSDIAERRSLVMQELRQAFQSFLSRGENFTEQSLFPDKETISPNLATGAGIAALGIILNALATLPALDITGGIITGLGVLFAGVTTSVKRKRIIDGYTNEIAKGRKQLDSELTDRLKSYIKQLKKRIDENFKRFDELLAQESTELSSLEADQKDVGQRLEVLSNKLSDKT